MTDPTPNRVAVIRKILAESQHPVARHLLADPDMMTTFLIWLGDAMGLSVGRVNLLNTETIEKFADRFWHTGLDSGRVFNEIFEHAIVDAEGHFDGEDDDD